MITMIKTMPGSPDGITVHVYEAGKIYGPASKPPLTAALADVFVRERWATLDAATAEAALRNADADGATTDTLLGSSSLAAVLTITEGVTITLGELVAKAFDASGLSIEEWNGLDDKARDLHLEDLLETLRAEAKPGEGTTATFTARHVGAGRYKVFDADDKPVTEAMDKDAATAEAALRNAEQGA